MSILNFLKAEDHPYLVIGNGDYQFLYIEKSDFEHVNDIKDFFIYKNLKFKYKIIYDIYKFRFCFAYFKM